jgi:hypothetical protein
MHVWHLLQQNKFFRTVHKLEKHLEQDRMLEPLTYRASTSTLHTVFKDATCKNRIIIYDMNIYGRLFFVVSFD